MNAKSNVIVYVAYNSYSVEKNNTTATQHGPLLIYSPGGRMRRRAKVSLFYWHLLGHFSHQLASILIYILHCKKILNSLKFLEPFLPDFRKKPLLIGKTCLYFLEWIFSFSILEFSSPQVLSRKFGERFLAKESLQDLGRIPGWTRGKSGKTSVCKQEHQLIQKDSVRIPVWEREYPGKLQAK